MTRSKIDWHFFVALLVLIQLCCQKAEAESPVPPQKDNDPKTVIYGCHEVTKDYHKRFPHAEEYDNRCWKGLEKNDLLPETKVKIELKSVKETAADIKAGPWLHKKAKQPQAGDKYCGFDPTKQRPQYWGLEVPCGAQTGYVYPPIVPKPGIEKIHDKMGPTETGPGPYVLQHAKNAKGEGGPISCAPPSPVMKCYKQSAYFDNNKGNISKEGDQSIWEYELTTFGVGPVSDTQYQMIERENNQRLIELAFDPERWLWTSKACTANQQNQMAQNLGHNADHALNRSIDAIQEYLINVANENAATPTSSSAPQKKQSEVIWMVQQMYKQVYIPMAILLLLPGAVMTQMKTMVQFGVLKMQDETTDTNNPFMGIIRSIIAVFLIPATQLIVSYMIDMGNSLHYECKKYVKTDEIKKYVVQQQPDAKVEMSTNTIEPTNIDPEGRQERDQAEDDTELGTVNDIVTQEQQGKSNNGAEKLTRAEKESHLTQGNNAFLNFMNGCLSSALHVLCAFQLVMMCYLFLMGPIAGALYAWPNINKGDPGLFNKVFANWLDAVVVLALWRFWWMVVLVTMTTYIEWSRELGFFDPSSQWEQLVLTSFQVLLAYVPFQPFNFNPKPMVEEIIKKGQQATQSQNQQGGPGGNSPSPGGGGPNPGGTTPSGGGPTPAATSPGPGGGNTGSGAPGGGGSRSGGSSSSSAPAMTPAPSSGGGSGSGSGGSGGGGKGGGGGGQAPPPQASVAKGVRTPMNVVAPALTPPPQSSGGGQGGKPATPPKDKDDKKGK